MYWMETIHLRSTTMDVKQKILNIFKQVKMIIDKDNHIVMRLFKDATIPLDYTIVLEWKCDDWDFSSTPLKSVPGMRLAENLNKFGLVNHSLFVEERVKL